jgi:hypothetical protein
VRPLDFIESIIEVPLEQDVLEAIDGKPAAVDSLKALGIDQLVPPTQFLVDGREQMQRLLPPDPGKCLKRELLSLHTRDR